jgi:L-ascorbate metabolism protein UlaG (beta-lactamase superfamily)
MQAAFQKDDGFLADVRRVLKARGRALWWLGQSGFLLAQEGRAVVFDPYLSDSLTRKYAATDKPHTRITERVVSPEALGSIGVINLITSSHNHTDHLDAETLLPLLDANPPARLVIPAANRDFVAERLGNARAFDPARFIVLDDGASATVAGMEICGVASAHPSVERDGSGRCRFLGYVLKWSGLTIYHSGDTLWHDGLVASLRNQRVDVALLPINGDRPERRVAGNLDGPKAAQLAHAIGARWVVPCHYDLFEFNTATPDAFVAECRRLGQPNRVLRNGEGWDPASG